MHWAARIAGHRTASDVSIMRSRDRATTFESLRFDRFGTGL